MLAQALRLGKVIVPVYHHMPVPQPEELVESIRQLLHFQAIFDTGNHTSTQVSPNPTLGGAQASKGSRQLGRCCAKG